MVDKANQGDRCNRVSEMRKGGKEAKIGMSMMSHRSLREGCAKRAWNSYYRRCFEWEVFGQIEVEMKHSAFVWAFGLVIVSTSANVRFFLGCWRGDWAYCRLDRAFPVEETGIIICNRETLDSRAYERQES